MLVRSEVPDVLGCPKRRSGLLQEEDRESRLDGRWRALILKTSKPTLSVVSLTSTFTSAPGMQAASCWLEGVRLKYT